MKSASWLTAVLVGVIVALTFALVASNFPASPAVAQGGGGGVAGSITAVTGEYEGGGSVLYIFDAQKEVLLAYAFHPPGRGAGGGVDNGELEWLAGRHIGWDLKFSELAPFGKQDGVTPNQVRSRYNDLKKNVGDR